MKLVIQTQVRENYGSADAPHWKFKGGEVYVMNGITETQAARIRKGGIPTLSSLLESRSSMYEEYIINHDLVDDDATVCEKWETPTELNYVLGVWCSRRVVENGEYGHMRREIQRAVYGWSLLPGGDRANYTVAYHLTNGQVLNDEQLNRYFAEQVSVI